MDMQALIAQNASQVEQSLDRHLRSGEAETCAVWEAMRYSTLGGGKRIRAFITLQACKACGADPTQAIDFACAVEFIHAASLIHDDLPCMDNDDFRRGKPSCHKAFGEATALLAGDALFLSAVQAAASSKSHIEQGRYDIIAKATVEIAKHAGADGMIGGQIMDLENLTRAIDVERLKHTNLLKTGKMIVLSAKLGCIAAGLDTNDSHYEAIISWAESIGLAYQIIDDLMDYDHGNGKLEQSYVALLGEQGARELAVKLTTQASGCLAPLGENAAILQALGEALRDREA